MRAGEIGALNTSQLAMLNTGQVAALTASQVGVLTAAQLGAMSGAQLAAMTATQIAGLSLDAKDYFDLRQPIVTVVRVGMPCSSTSPLTGDLSSEPASSELFFVSSSRSSQVVNFF